MVRGSADGVKKVSWENCATQPNEGDAKRVDDYVLVIMCEKERESWLDSNWLMLLEKDVRKNASFK